MVEFTVDTLFNRSVTIIQPRSGYRFSIDPVILAAHIRPDPGAHILDIGCGCGIIPLALGFRHPDIRITGIEIQDELADLARRNVIENRFTHRIRILNRDILSLSRSGLGEPVDLVVSNPPYRKKGTGRLNPDPQKAMACHEIALEMESLLEKSRALLKQNGTIWLIYPAERLPELLPRMAAHGFSTDWIRLVHPRPQAPALRVLISGTKGGGRDLVVAPPFFIQQKQGDPTKEYLGLFNA